jgi:hypothetical protein
MPVGKVIAGLEVVDVTVVAVVEDCLVVLVIVVTVVLILHPAQSNTVNNKIDTIIFPIYFIFIFFSRCSL